MLNDHGLVYMEKVGSQFLSLRQHFRSSTFSMGGMAANPSIKLGLSKNQTVFEIAELGDLLPGDGIFLQSFVLRHFSTVQEGQASLQQLAVPDSWGSNLSWTSECNESRTSWSILSEAF